MKIRDSSHNNKTDLKFKTVLMEERDTDLTPSIKADVLADCQPDASLMLSLHVHPCIVTNTVTMPTDNKLNFDPSEVWPKVSQQTCLIDKT